MRVLVACEFSGIVREAFHKRGHDAWSCDLLPTEQPGNHIQGDVLDILDDNWDLMIAHPPCQYLSYAGIRHWNKPGREQKRLNAYSFFMKLINAPIHKICVENPVGYPNTVYRKPDQIIHPYYFGDPCMKKTCLWLKGLPLLIYNKSIKPPPPISKLSTGKNVHWTDSISGQYRSHIRSKTFPAIAEAFANQWG